MINRRHIRVKVMQSVYAMTTSKADDLVKEEKFLKHSIQKLLDLYVLQLQMLVEVQKLATQQIELSKKKHLATKEDLQPNTKFINNKVIAAIANSTSISDHISNQKLDNWKNDDEYVTIIWQKLQASDLYSKYMNSNEDFFKTDKSFVQDFFTEIIAPDDKLAEYYEDQTISWLDDIPFVNTWILRTLSKVKENKSLLLGNIYKDEDDEKFVLELFRKVILNHTKFEEDISSKTPNWEAERIADIDMILIKMAICEFLKFPSIPVRVTINEYIEISKDYSTNKSGYFINGVLDKLSREYSENKRLDKIGRGLL
ncbi:Transcription antitermination protein NusB [Polaribacter huanghezhanensis]|uniref:transcription antitermination factor NusB n=1 Tax=Polaribacter huanghezhanensis TaxID=1354726 RepID=UPI0026486315|nr:transcription antitermination factor NusB [Polaribacter huanghezhanensis]WKD86870.1 Transcription antitermination protein NusB [Polaribacter huanghezhanensis]